MLLLSSLINCLFFFLDTGLPPYPSSDSTPKTRLFAPSQVKQSSARNRSIFLPSLPPSIHHVLLLLSPHRSYLPPPSSLSLPLYYRQADPLSIFATNERTNEKIIAGEPILRCQNTLGEGPLWDSERGVVNWVDIDKVSKFC